MDVGAIHESPLQIVYGQNIPEGKSEEETEIQGEGISPLPPLRPGEGVHRAF